MIRFQLTFSTQDNLNFIINGGDRVGDNLFHSFREFSILEGGSASFDNAADIQNIVGRVTGNNASNIDGGIRAQGNANLFLINPNGIIFGTEASLRIGGSFIASTADSIQFVDGVSFSATDSQSQPQLTLSLPFGLQFGGATTNIINQGRLEVNPGNTLALVGSDIFIQGGRVVSCFQRIIYGLRRRIISHPFGINVLSEYRRPSHYIAQQRVLMVLSLGLEFQLIRPKMGMF